MSEPAPLPHVQPTPQPLNASAVGYARAGGSGPERVLALAALIVAVAGVVVGGIALFREPIGSRPSSAPSAAQVPGAGEVAAAKTTACDAWNAASTAMVAARHPFVVSPDNWNDPATVSTLVQAEAGILVQVEYLRQHVPPATPLEVSAPIADYIAASVDLAAADGQHQSADVANAAADRGAAAAAKIRAACGL